MKNTKHFFKITRVVFAFLLMASSAFLVFSNSTDTTVNAQTSSSPNSASYGDIMQYEIYDVLGNSSTTRYNAGPAPSSADIMWSVPNSGSPYVAFDGKVFVRQNNAAPMQNAIIALNPFTGSIIWNTTVGTSSSSSLIFGIAPNYLVTAWMDGVLCIDTNTGKILWTMGTPTTATLVTSIYPGAIGESSHAYSPEQKMLYTSWPYTAKLLPRDAASTVIQGWSFSDPTKPPKLVWSTPMNGIFCSQDWYMSYGDGLVMFGTSDSREVALDATTGAVVWDTPVQGNRGYQGCYYMGMFLHGGICDYFTSLDGKTGKVLWTFQTGSFWSFWACGPAAAYGMVYQLNANGYLYALNVTTGQCVWKYGGAYEDNPNGTLHYYPGFPVVADGKVYQCIGTATGRNQQTGEYSTDETVCLDAYTGKLIWTLPTASSAHDAPIVAYGNLYLSRGGQVLCIGNSKPNSTAATNWSMYRGNPAQTAGGGGVSPFTELGGPTHLALKWKTNINGAVISSPTIVDGVVYIGSGDANIYALNANTGSKIWNFTTGYAVKSSVAVVGGKVYTGADDGTIHCLNATTGAQIWDTYAGGITVYQLISRLPSIRGSPIVVDGRVYVGSLDQNLYCLDANSGAVIWAFASGGPVESTPAIIANDGLYFTSPTPSPNGTLYKLDANSGAVIWKVGIPSSAGTNQYGYTASPTVVAGNVFITDDSRVLYCINATTGDIVWKYVSAVPGDSRGPTAMPAQGSVLYAAGMLYYPDAFQLDCINATTGELVWAAWLSREVYVSPSYAFGKVYIGCEEGTMRVLDATTGKTLSYYHPGVNIWSSPSLYNGNLYWGASDFYVYCFAQSDRGLTSTGGGTVTYGATASTAAPSPSFSPTATQTTASVTPIVTPTAAPTTAPPTAPSTASNPVYGGFATEYVYAIVAVIIIVAIAAAAYMMMKRKKQP